MKATLPERILSPRPLPGSKRVSPSTVPRCTAIVDISTETDLAPPLVHTQPWPEQNGDLASHGKARNAHGFDDFHQIRIRYGFMLISKLNLDWDMKFQMLK